METKKFNLSMLLVLVVACSAGLAALKQAPNSQGYFSKVGGAAIHNPQAVFVISEPAPAITQNPPVARKPLPALEIKAAAALAKDLGTGMVLYQRNESQVLPIASLTKLMTAIVVVKNSGPGEEVTITSLDAAAAPYTANFRPGETWTVLDLLRAMLVASANDAALALARHVGGTAERFVVQMNQEARALIMMNTHFVNPAGFDDSGHFSTANDLALLVDEFLKYPDLLEIVKLPSVNISSIDGRNSHSLQTTNKLMLAHPEIRGLKTGYTDEAKGNLIILTRHYYSILLGSRQREAETETLMKWIKSNYSWE